LSCEGTLLISLLKLTHKTTPTLEDVKTSARLPINYCLSSLQKLQNENLVYLNNDKIEIDSTNRLKIAVKAISLGADVQTVTNLLAWQEFEKIAAYVLKSRGYTVIRNLRFKHGNRRYEIDVVGCRKPLVVCIDCKRWNHALSASALKKIVEDQEQRVKALADSLPNPKINLECTQWGSAKFVSAVLSLMPGAYKFFYEVPVISVLQLQDFISQLPLCTEKVHTIPKKFSTLSDNF
jgi:Holliday junction resolvase-like predicted endonuclease